MDRRHQVFTTMTALPVLVSPFAVLFALPWFDGGIYRQVETVAVALHAVAAYAGIVLLLGTLVVPSFVRAGLSLPAAALAALAAVGAALAPFAPDWARSLHGSLELGVGVLWHLEAAVLTVAATAVWRASPGWRTPLAVSPVVAVVACAFLQSFRLPGPDGAPLVPYEFPEYLGILSLLACVPLLTRPGAVPVAVAVAVAVGGTVLGGNRSAGLALLAAAAGVAAVRRYPALLPRLPVLSVVGALALAVVLVTGRPVLERLATSGVVVPVSSPVPSVEPLDHVSVDTKPYGTLWSRAVTARIVFDEIVSDPLRALVGQGFGSYESVAQERSRSAPGRRLVDETPTASLTYWDGDRKARFHSHDMPLEMTLSAGLPGLVAWLFLVWSSSRTRRRTDVAVVTLSAALVVGCGLWFLVNAALPMLALALAATRATAREEEPLPVASPAVSGSMTLAAAGATVVCSAAAAFAGAALTGERAERGFFPILPTMSGEIPCVGYSALTLPDRQVNTALYAILERRVLSKGDDAREEYGRVRLNVYNYSCLLGRYARRGDLLALVRSLEARSDLLPFRKDEPPTPDYVHWADDLSLLLSMAPGRTDFLVPYVRWTRESGGDVTAAVDRFLPRVPSGDPVREWLLAQAAESRGDRAASVSHFVTALHQGLANVVPVDTATVRAVTDAVRR